MSDLAKALEVMSADAFPDVDEPAFPTKDHTELYRGLVRKMEAEATVLPGMGTAVGLIIRRLARDYVWGVVADQAVASGSVTTVNAARDMERDRRMMNLFKMLLDQAGRADLEHALKTEFVLGLVTEFMKVYDAELEDQVVRIRIKELTKSVAITYVESIQGRVRK